MTAADKFITVLLALISVAAMLLSSLFIVRSGGERVVISVNGENYASYNFSDIDGVKTVEVKTEFGCNTVKIDKNSAWIEESDCPDKLDIKAGKISKTNQMIVCIPNRLMVEIKGGETKADRVTY